MDSQKEEEERLVVERYLKDHGLEGTLNDFVNEVVQARPEDPYVELGQRLAGASTAANSVLSLRAHQIWNGLLPALEIEIETQQGRFTAKTCLEEDSSSVEAANNSELLARLKGVDVTNQEAVDAALKDFPNAKVVLLASVACCKAGAAHLGVSVQDRVAQLAGNTSLSLPMPAITVIEGQKEFRSIAVVPFGAGSMAEAVELVRTLTKELRDPKEVPKVDEEPPQEVKKKPNEKKKTTKKEAMKNVLPASKRGEAFGALEFDDVKTLAGAVAAIRGAIERAGLEDRVALAVDVASDSFASKSFTEEEESKTMYDLKVLDANDDTLTVDAEGLLKTYVDVLKGTVAIATLEDPFAKDDAVGFALLKDTLELETLKEDDDVETNKIGLASVGGDSKCLLQVATSATNDLEKADDLKCINTLSLSLSKGKTVTGCLELAKQARALGWGIQVNAAEAFETDESFAATLAVGLRATHLRTGGLLANEHVAKLNELLRIEEQGNNDLLLWPGKDFRLSLLAASN